MKVVLTLLLLFVVLYFAACGAVLLLQRSMIYSPQPALGRVPDRIKLPVDGAQVMVSVQPRPGMPAVLYFGGNAEDVSSSLAQLTAAWPQRAIYALHYRGYGGSTGTPSEHSLQADAAALFDHVQARHAEVTVVGRSLGTGIAVRLATQRPVSRLVLVTPFDSLVALAAPLFPWLPVRWLMLDRYDSARLAPAVKVPTLILVAERDEVVPHASTLRLQQRFAPGVATWKVMPGAGHNTISDSPAYTDALRSF